MRREPPAEQRMRLHNAKFMDLQTFRRETERKIGVILREKKKQKNMQCFVPKVPTNI